MVRVLVLAMGLYYNSVFLTEIEGENSFDVD